MKRLVALSALSSQLTASAVVRDADDRYGPDGSAVRADSRAQQVAPSGNTASDPDRAVHLSAPNSMAARTTQSVVFAELRVGKQSACASSSRVSDKGTAR